MNSGIAAKRSIAGVRMAMGDRNFGMAHGDVDGARVIFGFAFGYQKRRNPATGQPEVRPGAVNETLARQLTEPPYLGLPKVLEGPLALAYKQALMAGDDAARLLTETGELYVVMRNFEQGRRLSAAQVAIQGKGLLQRGEIEGPVLIASTPSMAARCDLDCRALGLETVVDPVMAADAEWPTPALSLMDERGWVNPHPWTGSDLVYRAYDGLARIRDGWFLQGLDPEQALPVDGVVKNEHLPVRSTSGLDALS